MKYEKFLQLPTADVAHIVREHGTKVCVFPINGTRRWFLLEHPRIDPNNFSTAYLEATITQHIRLYQLIFDHGIDTLLTPIFGYDLLERGAAYLQMAADGLKQIGQDERFWRFYEQYDVRVGFYGDYFEVFNSLQYTSITSLFQEVQHKTSHHKGRRLLFGLFANDATDAVSRLSIDYFKQTDTAPTKQQLIEMYYGEYIECVDFFIGFDKFSVFDMPLIANGEEDLYFTASPSLYLTQEQLRNILYDHLFLRTVEPDYAQLGQDDWQEMKSFYEAHQKKVFGVGKLFKNSGVWYPLFGQ